MQASSDVRRVIVLPLLLAAYSVACTGGGGDDNSSDTSTETGDGDGDTAGDGDGDTAGDGDGDTAGDGDSETEGDGDGDSGESSGWGEDPPGGDCEGEEPADIVTDDDPTLDCMSEATWPYDGPLCGPNAQPCLVEADVELSPAPINVNSGSPSIALGDDCRPQVLYSIAGSCFAGYHARFDGSWLNERMPMPMAKGLIAVEPTTQVPTALVDDGALHPSAWTRDPTWDHVATAPDPAAMGQALVRGLDGVLHAGYEISDDALQSNWVHASFDGTGWADTPLEGHGSQLEVAVSVAGEPHFAGWASGPQGWELRWQTTQSGSETVTALGSNSLEWQRIAMVTTGGDQQAPAGTPHVLHALASGNSLSTIDLAYSTRVGPDDWTTLVFAPSEVAEPCAQPPSGPDDTCDYDYVRLYPLDIVASENGEIRLLWTRDHHIGTFASQCDGPSMDENCNWSNPVGTSEGEVWVGWLEDGDILGVALFEGTPIGGEAALDPGGRIHLATYDRDTNETPSFRYRRLGF